MARDRADVCHSAATTEMRKVAKDTAEIVCSAKDALTQAEDELSRCDTLLQTSGLTGHHHIGLHSGTHNPSVLGLERDAVHLQREEATVALDAAQVKHTDVRNAARKLTGKGPLRKRNKSRDRSARVKQDDDRDRTLVNGSLREYN